MSTQPPYRMYCEAVAGKPRYFLGSRWQHGLAKVLAEKFTNTTTVENPAGGAPIAPYERWSPDLSGSGSCEVHHCVTDPGAAPCEAWPKPPPTNVFTDTGDKVDLTVSHKRGFKNVFARRNWHGVFGWVSSCVPCADAFCDDGTSYRSTYNPTPDQTKYLVVTHDVHYRFATDNGEAETIEADRTGARTVDPMTGEITSTLITTQTHRQDFRSTGDVDDLDISFFTNGGAGYDVAPGGGTTEFDSGGVTMLDDRDLDLHCEFPIVRAGPPGLQDFVSNWNAGGIDFPSEFVGETLPLMSDPNNYSGTATGRSNGGITKWTAVLSFSRTATVVDWDFTVTQLNENSLVGGTDRTTQWHSYGSMTLSETNTAASVKADLVTLLSYWPLDDDALYPFRTDLKTGVAPYMSRAEKENTSPIGFNSYTVDDPEDPGTPIPWFDPAAYDSTGTILLFDGSIKGIPKPAGYQDFFDFTFEDVRGCCYRPEDNPGFQNWAWYVLGWGQNVSTFNTNTGCHLPLNATQWCNWWQSINKPPCAFMFYGDQSDYYGTGCVSSDAPSKAGDAGAFVMGKWAEILDLWPSQNFGMPAGDAKFWFDETRVYCAVNASGTGEGSTWTLTDPTTGLPPGTLEIDDYWGGPVVDGFYAIAGYDGGTGIVTLGAKEFDLPSNWASKSDVGAIDLGDGPKTDADFCFGALRWPDKPSLLGRVAITTDVAGTTLTFASAQPSFGMDVTTSPNPNQEQVDLWDADMTLIAGNVTAIRTSNTEFTITAGLPSARFVTITGAAKYYINDTAPKGDVTHLEWTADLRSIGEYNTLTGVLDCSDVQVTRPTTNAGGGPVTAPFGFFGQSQSCVPFVPCGPKVVCISPNGETFPNGITYAFPTEFLLDEQYGSKWWGKVEPIMTDLLWQQPHRPCNIETCASWREDDGSCNPNVEGTCPAGEETPAPKYFFGFRPQVEARLTLPANYGAGQDESAPALPDSIQIGWLSPVNYDAGDVAFPPEPFGVSGDEGKPNGGITAWTVHELFCANATCRFNYRLPGCDT